MLTSLSEYVSIKILKHKPAGGLLLLLMVCAFARVCVLLPPPQKKITLQSKIIWLCNRKDHVYRSAKHKIFHPTNQQKTRQKHTKTIAHCLHFQHSCTSLFLASSSCLFAPPKFTIEVCVCVCVYGAAY